MQAGPVDFHALGVELRQTRQQDLPGRLAAFQARQFLLGGLVLAFYGYTVNAPPWDFGRLLGVYVAFFFVVAQLISWLGFGHKPTPMILLGGALIVVGGCVVSLAK